MASAVLPGSVNQHVGGAVDGQPRVAVGLSAGHMELVRQATSGALTGTIRHDPQKGRAISRSTASSASGQAPVVSGSLPLPVTTTAVVQHGAPAPHVTTSVAQHGAPALQSVMSRSSASAAVVGEQVLYQGPPPAVSSAHMVLVMQHSRGLADAASTTSGGSAPASDEPKATTASAEAQLSEDVGEYQDTMLVMQYELHYNEKLTGEGAKEKAQEAHRRLASRSVNGWELIRARQSHRNYLVLAMEKHLPAAASSAAAAPGPCDNCVIL